MKFTKTISLLSAMICSEAMYARDTPHRPHDAQEFDYRRLASSCQDDLYTQELKWSAEKVKKCIHAFVEVGNCDDLEEMLNSVVPQKLTELEKSQVRDKLQRLLVPASLDTNIACLKVLAEHVQSIPVEICHHGLLRAAASHSPDTVDFWIGRILGIPLETDTNQDDIAAAWSTVAQHGSKIPSDVGTEAIIEAFYAGDDDMTRKLLGSHLVSYKQDNYEIIKIIKRLNYTEQGAKVEAEAKVPAADPQVKAEAVEPSPVAAKVSPVKLSPPTVVEEPKQPESHSWWSNLTRMVTEAYAGPDSSWILPEETWDSTYGPRQVTSVPQETPKIKESPKVAKSKAKACNPYEIYGSNYIDSDDDMFRASKE